MKVSEGFKNNLFGVTNTNQTFPILNWYVQSYGEIPKEFILMKVLDFEKIQEQSKDKVIYEKYVETSKKPYTLNTLAVLLDDKGIILTGDSLSYYPPSQRIFYTRPFEEVKELFESLPKKPVKIFKQPSYLNFLACDTHGNFYLKPLVVKYDKLDLALNYNNSLLEVDKKIMSSFSDKKQSGKGLVLLYGIPGTGKTTYIRSLVKRNPKSLFVIVPTHLIARLTDPNFISFITNQKNLILVIEESEQALTKRGTQENHYISNILNMTDGLLGDCLNFKIIATFNTKIDNIDEALLRKGRLLVSYEFKELEHDKAEILREKLQVVKSDSNALSDIYNAMSETPKSEKKAIGFAA